MEKWGNRRDFCFSSWYLVGGWKSEGIENFCIWLRRKIRRQKCRSYKFTPLLLVLKKKIIVFKGNKTKIWREKKLNVILFEKEKEKRKENAT